MAHHDPSAYNAYQRFDIGSPCLSFDILHDDLGFSRSVFPHTVSCIAGSQATEDSENYIAIFRLSNLVETDAEVEAEAAEVEDAEVEGVLGLGAAVLQLHKVSHDGIVNSIRSMSQNPGICASWSDTGYMHVWDLTSIIDDLGEPSVGASSDEAPIFTFMHDDEGYALDWSGLVPGRLVSGGCNNLIHLWEPVSGATWNVDLNPFVWHAGSVEDLQWSPREPSLFASCSVDGTVAIWDTRSGKLPGATIEAHGADVNVISWNRLLSFMLASGSDDGSFSIWDLRLLGGSSVASFEYHEQPITSIEWSPHESSAFAVSSSDDQLTFWDLSYERVDEEDGGNLDVPPQLIFVHCCQQDLKELHWHPQIPGMVISTANDGFNVIIPSNLDDFATDA